MKIQLRNLVYRQATAKCFICSESRMDSYIGRPDLMLLRCVHTGEKCDFSNLYNDQIFKI